MHYLKNSQKEILQKKVKVNPALVSSYSYISETTHATSLHKKLEDNEITSENTVADYSSPGIIFDDFA